MTTNQKKKLEFKRVQTLQDAAGKRADELIARLQLSAPIDPLVVARTERPLLRAGGDDFRGSFDGKLKYRKDKRCFLLMYNKRYDVGLAPGRLHVRTRFSISHELGHFFIDEHHQYLRGGGKPHGSFAEYQSDAVMEREADAFAASLLMPTHLIRPLVNAGELSRERLLDLAEQFDVSMVSAAIRSVRLCHYPCALAGMRNGKVAWMFPSDALINAGVYPRRNMLPPSAEEPWDDFENGNDNWITDDGLLRNWFEIYDREDLYKVVLQEEYTPVPMMNTLLVLLTVDEDDLFEDEDNEEDE